MYWYCLRFFSDCFLFPSTVSLHINHNQTLCDYTLCENVKLENTLCRNNNRGQFMSTNFQMTYNSHGICPLSFQFEHPRCSMTNWSQIKRASFNSCIWNYGIRPNELIMITPTTSRLSVGYFSYGWNSNICSHGRSLNERTKFAACALPFSGQSNGDYSQTITSSEELKKKSIGNRFVEQNWPNRRLYRWIKGVSF